MAGGRSVRTVACMIQGIARATYRRRRAVVVLWLGVLITVSGLSAASGGVFRDVIELPGSEGQEGFDLLHDGVAGDRNWWLPHWLDRILPGSASRAIPTTMRPAIAVIVSERTTPSRSNPSADTSRISPASRGEQP